MRLSCVCVYGVIHRVPVLRNTAIRLSTSALNLGSVSVIQKVPSSCALDIRGIADSYLSVMTHLVRRINMKRAALVITCRIYLKKGNKERGLGRRYNFDCTVVLLWERTRHSVCRVKASCCELYPAGRSSYLTLAV